MLKKFLRAVSRDWASLVTGGLSIPLTVLAFWAKTPLHRTLWAFFAITCFLIASFRTWAFEYRRADTAEAQLATPPRPWVTVDGYSSEFVQDEETGEEYLWETVHLVNRGQAPAVSIVIFEIHLGRRTARPWRPLPTLGLGEAIDVEIQNLREALERVFPKIPMPQKGGRKSLRLPLVIEYRGLDHQRWTTEHTITYSVFGIAFAIAHPNDPQQWTDLSILDEEAARA